MPDSNLYTATLILKLDPPEDLDPTGLRRLPLPIGEEGAGLYRLPLMGRAKRELTKYGWPKGKSVMIYPKSDEAGELAPSSQVVGFTNIEERSPLVVVGRLAHVNRVRRRFIVMVYPNTDISKLFKPFSLTLKANPSLLETLPNPGRVGVRVKGVLSTKLNLEAKDIELIPLPPRGLKQRPKNRPKPAQPVQKAAQPPEEKGKRLRVKVT